MKEEKPERIVDPSDGTVEWWIKGGLHREDGPAVEYPNGAKMWYQWGKLHRVDGPAEEWIATSSLDYSRAYYFEGKHLGNGVEGFWNLWDILTDEQRNNACLHAYMAEALDEMSGLR